MRLFNIKLLWGISLPLLFALPLFCQNNLPSVSGGRVVRVENFPSRYVPERNIDIWLPEGYSHEKKYKVFYMHDGQMLFDSNQTWNKQAWDIDEVATSFFSENKWHPFIVVGIWNTGALRHQEYFPQKPFVDLTQIEKDTVLAQLQQVGRTKDVFQPNSDNYLKFIVKELKPYIDNNFSVFKERAHTFISGSSIGGLISLYALCEYPQIFGGAACLSTHWIGSFKLEDNPIPAAFLRYLNNKLPNPRNHKIYFDCGDQTLDALYPEIQKKVDLLLEKKGFDMRNWLTGYFPGENHSEEAWHKRLPIPLGFLFGISSK